MSTERGEVVCRPAFELTVEICRRYSPEAVESICGVGRDQVERAARLLWESRPVAYYAWSGVEQQSNATQIFRAISLLYALTGSFDAQGGNVLFPAVPTETWPARTCCRRSNAPGRSGCPTGRWAAHAGSGSPRTRCTAPYRSSDRMR